MILQILHYAAHRSHRYLWISAAVGAVAIALFLPANDLLIAIRLVIAKSRCLRHEQAGDLVYVVDRDASESAEGNRSNQSAAFRIPSAEWSAGEPKDWLILKELSPAISQFDSGEVGFFGSARPFVCLHGLKASDGKVYLFTLRYMGCLRANVLVSNLKFVPCQLRVSRDWGQRFDQANMVAFPGHHWRSLKVFGAVNDDDECCSRFRIIADGHELNMVCRLQASSQTFRVDLSPN